MYAQLVKILYGGTYTYQPRISSRLGTYTFFKDLTNAFISVIVYCVLKMCQLVISIFLYIAHRIYGKEVYIM